MNNVYIWGPGGSGKTHHAEALRKFYGKHFVVDGWEPSPTPIRATNALVLTNYWVPGAVYIARALEDAGIPGLAQEAGNALQGLWGEKRALSHDESIALLETMLSYMRQMPESFINAFGVQFEKGKSV